MRTHSRRSAILFIVLVAVFASATERINDLRPTVILVSIDGFRSDYLDRYPTPNLHAIMARGIHAKYMIPSFKTKTFPNHYTIVTGLYPAHHGIVANTMYDPVMNARFSMSNRDAVTDPRWWGGEPIWVTAERQGVRTAPLLWPGSQAHENGITPSYTQEFREHMPDDERLGKLIGLLDLPARDRPQFLTLYLDLVDDAGHDFGPGSEEVRRAVEQADSDVGELLDALRERGIDEQVNIVVISDHGMAKLSPKKLVYLDEYVDPKTVDIVDGSPVVSLRPKDGNAEALYEKLRRVPHAHAYLAADVPERWHFSGSRRITPVLLVADDEWTVSTRDYIAKHPIKGGTHGYDNELKDMRALFVAAGPAFYHGTMKPFANIHVYSLLAYLLNVAPAPNDGSLDVFKRVLIQRTQTEPGRRERAPWQKEWDEVARAETTSASSAR